jgi:hypothetical protein
MRALFLANREGTARRHLTRLDRRPHREAGPEGDRASEFGVFAAFVMALFVSVCVAVASPTLGEAPTVTLDEQAVLIAGSTPEGRLIVFSIGKPAGSLMPVTARFEELVVADATGAAAVELASPVAERSVWAVVDVESGELALAAPGGSAVRQVSFPGRGVGLTRRFLVDERRFLEVLLVRPVAGVPAGEDAAAVSGAWGQSFGDGGEGDGDGALDGKIEALLARLRPIGESPELPPAELRPGDVVVAVDPMTLEIYAAKLAF